LRLLNLAFSWQRWNQGQGGGRKKRKKKGIGVCRIRNGGPFAGGVKGRATRFVGKMVVPSLSPLPKHGNQLGDAKLLLRAYG